MAGALTHLAAGFILFIIGYYVFKSYFKGENKTKDILVLLFVCLGFSIIPDFFLIIYYITYISSFEEFLYYHYFINIIIIMIVIISPFLIKYNVKKESRPIFIMAISSLTFHIIMDLLVEETSLWL